MISAEISQRIRLLSFVAMFSVILIHCPNVHYLHAPGGFNVYLENLLCKTWTSWAVPFFFAVSGFFFAETKKLSYGKFLLKKVKTLVVPYLLWAITGAVFQLITAIPNNRKMAYPVFANTVLQFSSVPEILNALFGVFNYSAIGNGLVGPFGNRPLWYIRTLLLIFLFAPLFDWLRHFKILMVALAAFLIWGIPDFLLPFLSVRMCAVGFFVLGILFSEWKDKIYLSDFVLITSGIMGIALAFLFAYQPWLIKYGERIFPFLVAGGLWYIFRHWQEYISDYSIFKYSFWVYCIHPLFSMMLIVFGYMIGGKNNVTSLVLLLVVPWLVLAIGLMSAQVCSKYLPRIFSCLTGGRA